jgi:hypothetical protein
MGIESSNANFSAPTSNQNSSGMTPKIENDVLKLVSDVLRGQLYAGTPAGNGNGPSQGDAIGSQGGSQQNSANSTGGIDKDLMQLLKELIKMMAAQSQAGQNQGADDADGSGSASGGCGGGSGANSGGVPSGGAPSDGVPSGGTPSGGAPSGGTPSGGAPSGDAPSGGAPAQAIADNLRTTFGLNNTQIAGVLGNLQQESGLAPNVNQGGATGEPSSDNADDNQNGWGLAQWGGARKTGEIAYAQQNGLDPGSMQANLGFMDQELKGSYGDTITDLKQSSTAEGAALVWDQDYEKATAPNMTARNQYADQFVQELGTS